MSRLTPILILWLGALSDPAPRAVRLNDLPEALGPRLAATEFEFDALLDHIEHDTQERLAAGEHDQLIYYVLQSNSFTDRAPIDPLAAAAETAVKNFQPTALVRARMRDFLAALEPPSENPRLAYWRSGLTREQKTLPVLEAYFHDAIEPLRRVSAASGAAQDYTNRNHSTDTTLEASAEVAGALGSLRRLRPDLKIEKVLVVGPGQDFAPLSRLHDDTPPQSFEPFLVADALLAAKLAEDRFLVVQCLDINSRVLNFLRDFKRRAAPRLILPVEPGSPSLDQWFETVGRSIGIASQDAYRRTIAVRPSLASRVTGQALNIATQRLVPPPEYDLAVVMNVFPYLRNKELVLALANLHSMLRPGGFLIHNEKRDDLTVATDALRMPEIQSGTTGSGTGARARFFLHERK